MADAKPRIAIIGGGIAGLSAAWLLQERYDITLYEAQARAGGHADTQFVTLDGERIAVDTGFICFNDRTYPNLTRFFDTLGVVSRHSQVSFSVSGRHTQFEYAGGELRRLLAQPANMFSPRLWRLVLDILRFHRQPPAALKSAADQKFGDYLRANGYSASFIDDYILPLAAATRTTSTESIRAFPARDIIRYFHQHGMLQWRVRTRWRTVTGGSKTYVDRVLADLAPNVLLAARVRAVRRYEDKAVVEWVQDDGAHSAEFSQVVFACPADEALALMRDPTLPEAELLGAIRFQDVAAVLHQDASLMPRRRRAWSAWNFLGAEAEDASHVVCVTYWMNPLLGLKTREPLMTSLNPPSYIDPDKILRRKIYRHLDLHQAALRAQERLGEIQGQARFWFAGAWTGWGLHEDGINSAIRIANALGVRAPWQDG